jgi:hypothetical protein
MVLVKGGDGWEESAVGLGGTLECKGLASCLFCLRGDFVYRICHMGVTMVL